MKIKLIKKRLLEMNKESAQRATEYFATCIAAYNNTKNYPSPIVPPGKLEYRLALELVTDLLTFGALNNAAILENMTKEKIVEYKQREMAEIMGGEKK